MYLLMNPSRNMYDLDIGNLDLFSFCLDRENELDFFVTVMFRP